MSVLEHVPQWAKPTIDAWCSQQHLIGEVKEERVVLGRKEVESAAKNLANTMETYARLNDTGELADFSCGRSDKVQFQGDARNGASLAYLQTYNGQGIQFSSFDENGASTLLLFRQANGRIAGEAVYIDRTNPARSFATESY